MQIAVLGIDLGKTSCSLVGLDARGRVVLRRRMRRDGVVELAAGLPACVVAMEACCGAHHLGRVLHSRGHQVRLMSPEYVRPYVKAQKNDDRDAEVIAGAATRPTMRFVELESEERLDQQTLHRVRRHLVGERTALINQLRGMLLERGITVVRGQRKLELHLARMMAETTGAFGARFRLPIEEMRAEWRELDRRSTALDDEFAARARSDEAARLLTTIPGIGVLNATASTAAIGNGEAFGRARDLAALARLGAEADDHRRQAAPAGHQQAWQRLSAHAAGPRRSSSLAIPRREPDADRRLALRTTGAGAPDIVVVALASKPARIAWAVLRSGRSYEVRAAAAG